MICDKCNCECDCVFIGTMQDKNATNVLYCLICSKEIVTEGYIDDKEIHTHGKQVGLFDYTIETTNTNGCVIIREES